MYFIMQYMRIKRHHHVDYSTIDFCAVDLYRFYKADKVRSVEKFSQRSQSWIFQ